MHSQDKKDNNNRKIVNYTANLDKSGKYTEVGGAVIIKRRRQRKFATSSILTAKRNLCRFARRKWTNIFSRKGRKLYVLFRIGTLSIARTCNFPWVFSFLASTQWIKSYDISTRAKFLRFVHAKLSKNVREIKEKPDKIGLLRNECKILVCGFL